MFLVITSRRLSNNSEIIRAREPTLHLVVAHPPSGATFLNLMYKSEIIGCYLWKIFSSLFGFFVLGFFSGADEDDVVGGGCG